MNKKCICFLILTLTILIDQLSKYYIREFINVDTVVLLSDFLNVTPLSNAGISFGLFNHFSHSNSIFIFLNTIIVFGVLIALLNSTNKVYSIGLSMLLGGAISNLIDRFFYGSVYDFIDLHIYSWHWPIFNVADITIIVGVSLMFCGELRGKKRVSRDNSI